MRTQISKKERQSAREHPDHHHRYRGQYDAGRYCNEEPQAEIQSSRTVTSGRVWTMVFGDVADIDEPAEHGRTGR